MLFNGFDQCRRLTAVVLAVGAVSIAASVGCGTAATRTGGPATGSPATGSPATGSPVTGSPATGSPAASSPAAGGPAVIVVRDNANGKAVSARAGSRIELILSSSYWHVTGSSVPSVLRQDGPPVLLSRPSSCPDIPGLGCTPVQADFNALTDGSAVITATRSSCGEALRCRPDQMRFTVIVDVRN